MKVNSVPIIFSPLERVLQSRNHPDGSITETSKYIPEGSEVQRGGMSLQYYDFSILLTLKEKKILVFILDAGK